MFSGPLLSNVDHQFTSLVTFPSNSGKVGDKGHKEVVFKCLEEKFCCQNWFNL